MNNKDEIRTLLTELLLSKADFVFLFGSWAKENAQIRPESDVDCGAFFNVTALQEQSLYDITERFEIISGRKLDLICLNTADIIIASQIVATGEVIFSHSKERLNAYQALVMSRYFDFKQSRKIIENHILVRPKYGQ
ncbi:MAG: hypothetical protein B6I37_04320 [Desulfobacteraceae bacterium 4572_35.2]|nr:MAG: hypothetical protein B6I37_04320 [Desulfobacteraceae bacterium 4572_35.2]